MSLEEFGGLDGGEGMSAAAFEKFKEKMKKAQAQIAQIQKQQKKQKKKEDELIKILLHFIHSSQKFDLVLLISRALEKNVPAFFVLALALLGNEEIQHASNNFLALASGQADAAVTQGQIQNTMQGLPDPNTPENEARTNNLQIQNNRATVDPNQSLVFFGAQDDSLPLKVKIELDSWIKNLIAKANEHPQKILDKAYKIEQIEIDDGSNNFFGDKKYKISKTLLPEISKLGGGVVRNFLESFGIQEPLEKLEKFTEFIVSGILKKTQEELDNRQMIGGEVEDL